MTNPISKTAYYTMAVRAWDAAQPKPICGDILASTFMNEEAQAVWSQFKDFIRPNTSNASRHVIIDHDLQRELRTSPDSQVIIIGAGFDTRAFRLGKGRWIEIDDSSIIAYKETKLRSSTAPNPLVRVSIDFAKDSLSSKLAPFATSGRTFIIVEGVLMYLKETERQELVRTLLLHFPNHVVYCDLMRASFFNKYSQDVHKKIQALGATFTDIVEHPERLFLDAGYSVLTEASIPLYAATHGQFGIARFLVRYFLRTLRNGYVIWKLEHATEK